MTSTLQPPFALLRVLPSSVRPAGVSLNSFTVRPAWHSASADVTVPWNFSVFTLYRAEISLLTAANAGCVPTSAKMAPTATTSDPRRISAS